MHALRIVVEIFLIVVELPATENGQIGDFD